ncbi:hypothetical protein [Salinisphaera sp. G21_0]|uniref:hypothetical protein n=1 Tax=Salinisphaera sp. G21_0 TaxID=2821094 RepID=UPI001ADA0772|nr:hypothetical protein [Salinisphaera sp. G21_0]MBO9484332.1 hypothetical protein [Salinisphaera sp. G21_0]
MNHCPVSADERRHAHQEGLNEARQDYIDTQANERTARIEADLLSARKDNITSGYYNLKFSSESLALLQLMLSELPEEIFGLAKELVKQDLENRDEI